jgi:uncharacterized protein with von Willebrand factor type A (vWA) domain
MDDKLVEFSDLLRRNGVRVSIAEVLDAMAASRLTGLADRETFHSTLRTTLVKRAVDGPVFDELFDLYFGGLGALIKQAGENVRQGLRMSEAEFQAFLDRMEQLLQEHGRELSELAKALLRNDDGRLEKLLKQAAASIQLSRLQRPMEEGHFAQALARALGLDGLFRELEDFRRQLQADQPAPGQEPPVDEYLEQRMRALEDLVRRYVRSEVEKRDRKTREEQRLRELSEKSFAYLTNDELDRMNQAVTRLAQRLKNIIAVRRRRARRGRFDVKKTLRHGLACGGVPFKLKFDRRRREKPQVVVLCDVSDSVRNVSRFMLQFVYALQDLYSRVRSFIFVADIGEITEHFREHDASSALELALRGEVINVYAHSNFGRAFRLFFEEHIAAVNKKTTVIVLGDGRNNYNLPHDWCLREIRQRARQLIWLNPESRQTWGFGDSEMERYAVYCDMVEECRNLNQLYRVIDRLVTAGSATRRMLG